MDREPKLRNGGELLGKIMEEISREKKKAEFRKTVFFIAAFLVALAAVVPAFNLLRVNVIASGLPDYLSLLVSDYGSMLRYWDYFSLSLLESLPVASLAVFLSVVFILLESMKQLAAEITNWRVRFKLN